MMFMISSNSANKNNVLSQIADNLVTVDSADYTNNILTLNMPAWAQGILEDVSGGLYPFEVTVVHN